MLKTLIAPIALAAAACSPHASEPAAKSDMDNMSMGETSGPAAGAISSTGTVTAVDAAAGTISLDHEPIPAISWPAMSMQFHAEDPSILQGVTIGDHVAFELKSAEEPQTITMVQRQ